jgi:plastocyanin
MRKLILSLGLVTAVTATAGEQVREVTLTLGDYRFAPDTLELMAGQPVVLTLINTDTITPHNFVMDNESAGLTVDVNVAAGKSKSIEFTPATPGSYTFFCSKKLPFMKSHRQKGMEGTLIVK